MPPISQRLQAVQPPVIPIVAGLIREHPGTVSLGQGVVSYAPPQQVREAIDRFFASPDNHQYKLVDGIDPLRDQICRKLEKENGIAVGMGNAVVVTAGGNMAFLNAILAIADPSDEIILQSPFYFNHEMAVTVIGCQPVLVPTDLQFQPVVERIRAAITSRTQAVVTISPNNPTGAVYPESLLREINVLCREAGIFHIHDEAYEYFTWDGAKHFSPGSIDGAAGHTISLYSLSKAYGFASWRIGYQVIPGHLLDAVKKVQDTNLICPPVISQYAAAAAMEAGHDWCRPRLTAIREVREIVTTELDSIRDICEIPPVTGAFYFLLKPATQMNSMRLVESLIRDHGVAAIPGDAFGHNEGCAIRISYGALTRDTAREGMQRLVKGLRALCVS